jgi:hypothetical protein
LPFGIERQEINQFRRVRDSPLDHRLTAKTTLRTTVLRSFGSAAFSPRFASLANRRTVPILATSYLSSPNAEG